jgi:ketosteroid isomerase-like protein
MSHEQALRRLYEAFNNDDSAYLRSAVTDDVVVHVLPNELIPAATLRGREELVATHEKNLAATNLRQEVESISVCGSFATAYVVATGTDAQGNPRTSRGADLFRFADELICEVVGLVE